MRKLFYFLLLGLMLLSLCSCQRLFATEDNAQNGANESGDTDENPSDGQQGGQQGEQDDDGGLGSVTPFGPLGKPVSEADQAFFDAAFALYGWCELGPSSLQLDYARAIEIDGILYPLVCDPLYDTPETVRRSLSQYFSDDICAYIESCVFIEQDGLLYVADAARGADASVRDQTLYLTSEDEDKRVFTMEVAIDSNGDEIADTTQTYVYEAEKIDGKFRFTVFPYYL